jgi:hypothetical protein
MKSCLENELSCPFYHRHFNLENSYFRNKGNDQIDLVEFETGLDFF